MKDVFVALRRAGSSLVQPQLLGLVLWPAIGALVLWGGLTWFFWGAWVAAIQAGLEATWVQAAVERFDLAWLVPVLAKVLLVALLIPSVWITALLVAAVFVMPAMLKLVAARDYPELERRQGGSFVGSIWNAVVAVTVFLALWVVTLPAWLLGPLAVMIPVALSAYLNQRLFRYDALAEHASRDEISLVLERSGGRLYILGGILGALQLVPVVNLLMPVYAGLAFIHFCLEDVRGLRAKEKGRV